jgi:hypothetical protein
MLHGLSGGLSTRFSPSCSFALLRCRCASPSLAVKDSEGSSVVYRFGGQELGMFDDAGTIHDPVGRARVFATPRPTFAANLNVLTLTHD